MTTDLLLSKFFEILSRPILGMLIGTFPLLLIYTSSLPSDNDLDPWLPRNSEVRRSYEQYLEEFGSEEVILIALEASEDPRLVEAIAARIEQHPSFRKCWTPQRITHVLDEFSVSESERRDRLRGLIMSQDGRELAIIALLSDEGLRDRSSAVRQVERALDYSLVPETKFALVGEPVVSRALDQMGGIEASRTFFIANLLICGGFCFYYFRQWNVTLAVLGLTIWSIQMSVGIIKFVGWKMNFILGALPVMVMIFTLTTVIHVLHYYTSSTASRTRIGRAVSQAAKPCVLATLTTAIGLCSLGISDIPAVRGFGVAGTIGCLMALVTGLLLTPAMIVVLRVDKLHDHSLDKAFTRFAPAIIRHRYPILGWSSLVILLLSVGLISMRTHLDHLDFLPTSSKVRADMLRIEQEFAPVQTIEVLVDFTKDESEFVTRLQRVRELHERLAAHPKVKLTTSLATYFPTDLPDSPLELGALLSRAQNGSEGSDYLAHEGDVWRISNRVKLETLDEQERVLEELKQICRGENVSFTGLALLVKNAQYAIFRGFWESFAAAFLVITVIMAIALRSVRIALIAMIPNLTPISIVFGAIGLLDIQVDVGMMMTASIALGIAVDGTFHYLSVFRHANRSTDHCERAQYALVHAGSPIAKAAFISAMGMLALTTSQFGPTYRFGIMMAVMSCTALLGDLILLPALMALGKKNQPADRSGGLSEEAGPSDRIETTEAEVIMRHDRSESAPSVNSPSPNIPQNSSHLDSLRSGVVKRR